MKKTYNNYQIIADEHIYSVIKDALLLKITAHLSVKPFFSIALSGGNTPKKLYSLLARELLPWDRIKIFPVDERVLPPGSNSLNWKMIEEEFISFLQEKPLTFPPVNIHVDPEKCSLDLEEILKRELPVTEEGIPVIDLMILGVGTDGHSASIFPGNSAFKEEKRLVMVTEGPPPFEKRITFTFPLISSAGERWFLVTGYEKKEILGKIFKDTDRELPACKIGHYVPSLWFLDASSLPEFIR
ncbi:MAG: 6-phosphogluconolactonase [Candidatus Eremiobacterota bacterium]